jgi:exopolysaccharide biosynthesis polyprenyl glycosylphosphotransferase
VGLGEPALRIGRQIEQAAAYGVRLTGFLSDQNGSGPERIQLGESYPVEPLSHLPELLRRNVIDEVIFAVDSQRLAELEEMFLLCDEEGVQTRVAVDFFPHINSQVYLDRLGSSALLTFSATPHDEIRLLVKRVTDIVLATAALVLLLPFMAAIALLIRLTSPGPAIFSQIRCGLNGRRFVFYKFRSMCEDAEGMRASLQHLSERQTAMKIPNDPRLTPVGRWLRKFSIDEWPQLWNVLKGDMSLVGPRPHALSHDREFERRISTYARRHNVKPGITGWAQINGWRGETDSEVKIQRRVEHDLYYIENWSLLFDLYILARTPFALLRSENAY